MSNELFLLTERIKELEQENSFLKQQQLEITKAKELYLKIFEDFPALIWRSRLDKLCDYFNKTWLDFTGRTMEQEFGTGWAEGVHPDDFDSCLQTYVTAFDERRAFLMEYRMKNKDGEYRWIRDFGRPFYDLDNTFLGYIGSCYDITDNKNNERQLIDLIATKDKFFGIVAHDLRNPFNAFLGMTQFMADELSTLTMDEIQRIAESLKNSAINLFGLLENLLQWSRMQTGLLALNRDSILLKPQISESMATVLDMAFKKGVSVSINIPEDIVVSADKNMLDSIIRNLGINAVKFTPKGGSISVSAKVVSDNSTEISVKDTGIGMSPEMIANMFKLDADIKRRGTEDEPSSGLGLIICSEFVQKQNGTMWVESEVGVGSSFSFSIPGL